MAFKENEIGLDTLQHWCNTVIEGLEGAENAILVDSGLAIEISLLIMSIEAIVRTFTIGPSCEYLIVGGTA